MTTLIGNPFSYPSYDLTTGNPIDAIPYQGVTFGRALNQPGPWAGALPLADPRVHNYAYVEASNPSRTAMFVDLGGVLIWGGIVWTRKYRKADPQKLLTVGAMEFGSYFRQRLQAADYSTTWAAGADPMTIAQTVLNDAMAAGTIMGGITLTLHPAGGEGGNVVSPSYPGTSLQTIESIVQILSQMGYTFGFDYSFDVAYLPGTHTPGITLNIWYPRQGQVASASQIVILSKDTVDWTYDEDGTQQANSITETGSGTGTVVPATASVVIPGYPLLQRAFSRTQVTDEGTLANIALGDLGLYCYPPVTPTITIPVPMPNAQGQTDPARLSFGQFNLGDNLIFRVDPVAGGGENTDPRFPNGMSFEWRINAWTCTVQNKGLSTIVFDLGIPPLQTIPPPQPPLG